MRRGRDAPVAGEDLRTDSARDTPAAGPATEQVRTSPFTGAGPSPSPSPSPAPTLSLGTMLPVSQQLCSALQHPRRASLWTSSCGSRRTRCEQTTLAQH